MAVVHRTTMSPGKLELLTSWLPTRPWYVPTGSAPELAVAGGFRLDDPDGEVGIEFMVVTDTSGDRPAAYLVPLTYRGAPLAAPGDGQDTLVGTSEHGVLGRRWIYDGAGDPVLVVQLLALLQGRAEPQAQSRSDAPDPTVTRHGAEDTPASPTGPATATDGPDSTGIGVPTDAGLLTLTLTRLLHLSAPDSATDAAQAWITAPWRLPDGTEHRAPFASLRVGP
ncbi:maltokinase N-terminal cap-like domain-containing protein [Streptomyces ficellus]|uniref:1,4-alpha-glucan branching protein n=1 Tax=Streptomyces ficellus TaxID=1977088 RepID=A0A6I6F7B9_9ACTN|nr:1,4-alpha-glucan branching protein [Streptomyces ficellus]QGV76907.1 1,4-alpha-glucan branching protein [Streptomyces ficellus]